MHYIPKLLYTAGSLLLSTVATAQRVTPFTNLRDFSEQRIRHQKTLGLALGSYALANIAVGSIAAGMVRHSVVRHSGTTGETKYFHRMNVYWNLFNLGIAGAGLLGSRNRSGDGETLGEAIRQHQTIKQVLLFNAGLDVAYVVGGVYLRERGRAGLPTTRPDKADQLRGYGKSVMLQGGFLFAFDVVNYLIFKNRGDKQQFRLLSAGPMGVGMVVPIK